MATKETLEKQRSVVKANINRIKNMYQTNTASLNPIDVECRLEILTSYIKQLMSYQTEIEKINPEDTRRGELEEICITAKSLLLSKLGGRRPSTSNDFTMSFPQPAPSHRLPNLKIPKFNGKYSEYKNFISCFNNLVNDDPNLSTIEKFNHLINSLQDDALRMVKAFQVTEENYKCALERLAERYDNKCLIFQDHIATLFNLKKMSKPSASDLRNIVDTVSAVLDSLSNLGTDKDITNAIIVHQVLSKVDYDSKSKWDEQLDYSKLPNWEDCASVLIKRCQFLEINDDRSRKQESTNANYSNNNKNVPNMKNNNRNQAYSFSCSENKVEECLYCNRRNHFLENCYQFGKLKVNQRFEFVKSKNLCLICFVPGHSVKNCKNSRCRICQLPHHVLLHNEELVQKNLARNSNKSSDKNQYRSHCCCQSTSAGCSNHSSSRNEESSSNENNVSSLSVVSDNKQVVLATAIVELQDKRGNYQLARALLDSGSQINLMTEELAQRLGLNKNESDINIVGVGNNNRKVSKSISALVKSRINDTNFNGTYYIMKSIIHKQPGIAIDKDSLRIPANIVLADPEFNRPQRIDMLIGAESFFELMSIGQIKLGPLLPILQKTLLGWIVSGTCETNRSPKSQQCQIVANSEEDSMEKLNKLVQRFWEIEEVPSCSKMTEEQLLCESHFTKTTIRVENGRFEVRLPFKSNPNILGNSYEIAKRRFLALERKVNKTPEMREMYIDFMKEYIHLGHMSPIKEIPRSPHYFIPHQCVIRAQSTTTKLRVVFDASSKTSTLVSLNDTLMVGPTIQNDLFSTLLKFRLNRYALTADITKMYRQIQIHKDDRKYQLILWRETPEMPIQMYELNTVTYGTAPAPFLAIRCLKEISDIFKEVLPLGANVIENDFYVDDLLSGADDVDTLMKIRKEVIQILSSCGCDLAKWYSNCDEIINKELVRQLEIKDSDSTRALGIIWKPKDDNLNFTLEDSFDNLSATKRNILSISSRLFDPLGLLAPIVITAKIILQEIWEHNLDWDESIPQCLDTAWRYVPSCGDMYPLRKIPQISFHEVVR